MDFSPFFSGGASREESASAILAMSLAGVPSFRRFFFELVAAEDAERLSRREWTVAVEENYVDVRLNADDTAILIENKTKAASVQPGQLLRYYLEEITRAPQRRLIMVYLAPGGRGKQEVDAVRLSKGLLGRRDDIAIHISWQNLGAYTSGDDDVFTTPVRAGLTEIIKALKTSGGVRYPVAGDRESLVAIHDQAFERIRQESTVQLRPWRDRSYYQTLTAKTAVTAWMGFEFSVDPESDEPAGVIDNTGLIAVTIRHQFKLSAKAAKTRPYKDWWIARMETPFHTRHGDTYTTTPGDWLIHERAVQGPSEEIVDAVARSGVDLLASIGSDLATHGLKFGMPSDV